MRLVARIAPDLRVRVDATARRTGRSVSDVVRAAAILGVGGTAEDATEVNRVTAAVRAALVEAAGFPAATGRRPRGRGPPATVSVRLPRAWAHRVIATGGLGAAVARGVEKAGGGR